jgi:Ni/Co efflux regulator RcnB
MNRTICIALISLIATFGFHSTAVAEVRAGIEFSKDEVNIIATWYREHGSATQPKKRGKKPGSLPPGIAKNLARGKPLPPGIAKQYLPDSLVHALPAPPRGFERVVVDGKILLVEVATRVIHDILTDAILR